MLNEGSPHHCLPCVLYVSGLMFMHMQAVKPQTFKTKQWGTSQRTDAPSIFHLFLKTQQLNITPAGFICGAMKCNIFLYIIDFYFKDLCCYIAKVFMGNFYFTSKTLSSLLYLKSVGQCIANIQENYGKNMVNCFKSTF